MTQRLAALLLLALPVLAHAQPDCASGESFDKARAVVAEPESIAPYPGDAPITRDRIFIARKWPQHYGGLNAYRDAEQD